MQKTFGTDVVSNPIDYRKLTSYYGEEFPRLYTGEIYGEDKFVHQSMWSHDEYYMSLGNTPHDVVSLES